QRSKLASTTIRVRSRQSSSTKAKRAAQRRSDITQLVYPARPAQSTRLHPSATPANGLFARRCALHYGRPPGSSPRPRPMEHSIRNKLEYISERFEELGEMLCAPEINAD